MRLSTLFKFKTLRMTIAIPAICFFLVTSLAIAFIAFNGSNIAIEGVIRQLEISTAQVVEKELDTLFSGAERLNQQHKLTYERGLVAFGDNQDTQRYFTSSLSNMPSAVMTYVGFPNGHFYGARRTSGSTMEVVRNNVETGGNSQYFAVDKMGGATHETSVFKNFDPRKRPWYLKAVENKSLSFTDMYSHFVLKEPTITASLPIYSDDGRLLAVFGVDFLTTWLKETLKALPIGEHGQVIIVDAKNQIVASTTGEPLFQIIDDKSLNIPITDSQHPVTRAIHAHKGSPTNELTIDGETYYISESRYDHYGFDWKVYTAIASRDYLNSIYDSLKQTLGILLLMSIVSVILTFRIAQSIVRPIKALDQASQELLDGYFSPIRAPGRRDEIRSLTDNFNVMGVRLTSQVDALESQVKARTLELEHKNELLKDLAETDALTGISNRRRFIEFSQQAIDLAARHRTSLAFIMMDIDHFKDYNDTYGHIAGDHVIKAIADVLKKHVKRRIEIVSRYGGEEFSAILQDTDLEHATQMCLDIKNDIEGLAIVHKTSEFGIVTISIGLYYGLITNDQTAENLVELADQALYLAKRNGRNRLESISPHSLIP